VRAGFASEIEVLRRRGVSPRDFLEQVSQWRKEVHDKGLVFTSDAANEVSTGAPTGGSAAAAGDGTDTHPGGGD
jgi:capsid protein